jgi:hypothetical protein
MNNCDSNFIVNVPHKHTTKAGTPTGNITNSKKKKKGWGTLVPRINVENVCTGGYVSNAQTIGVLGNISVNTTA